MIKILTVFLVIGLIPSKCDNISARESCKVIEKLLYGDGEYSFSPEERMALRKVNKEKIVAVKDYYRDHCLKK